MVSGRRGFTLLEVMVAVAILGLSLTVILSAQAGLYASASYAQEVSVATGLARCRMSELEERMLRLGYPELDEIDEGPCCEDDTQQQAMRCSWRIEKIELPEPQQVDLTSGSANPASSALGGAAAALGGPAGASSPSSLDPLSTLSQLSMNPSSIVGDGGIAGIASQLGPGGLGAMAPLVMGFVYPQLKLMLEASIRKVTVTVTWQEGIRTRDFALVQYLTHPMKSPIVPGLSSSATPGAATVPTTSPFSGGIPGLR